MPLFRRGKPSAAAIAEFWRWWPGVRGRAEVSIDRGWDDALLQEFNAKVAAIHPKMQWEVAKDATSEHALIVCSAGDPALRATAERWLAAAPPADATWAYHSTRQPDPEAFEKRLIIEGREVELAELRFAVHLDLARFEVDVSAYHPLFASVPERTRRQITYLALDWALGETGVELWLGRVETATTPPERPQTVRGLRAAVAELEDRHRDDSWAVLAGEDARGVPMIASIQSPLKPVRWPRFDTHLAVVLPYRHRLDNGFPDDASLAALRTFEDQIIDLVRGHGALVAHESRNGRRTLHIYLDGTTGTEAAVRTLLAGWGEGRATATAEPDPAWRGISHLRG